MSTNRSVSFIQWRRAPQRPSSNRIWPNRRCGLQECKGSIFVLAGAMVDCFFKLKWESGELKLPF
ncbi:hypothetical protein T05_3952 [Trichinella murrelli]|uniref:Uncharacterized protein n=1 Tax=Trichinella murrelli TaxID=144512 RepID=A0A0V0UFV0_9BILA|nr:hypothetical protein T05_3952 [Trichinella murrelli]